MHTRTLIGVDIGTQGVKAALFTEAGACLASAFVPSRLNQPAPGVVEEDPEFQFQSVCQVIRRCVIGSGVEIPSVAGIAIDGQMAGVIGVGEDGRSVTPYDSWLDTRCAPYITEVERAVGAEVLAKTGCAPSFNHGPKILWWMNERVETFKRITAFVQPGGYAAMRLCGLPGSAAFIDTTYLHFSGFADNRRSAWDEGLAGKLGVDREKLPRIVKPSEVVGQLAVAAAKPCGLRAGTPVVAGCGDTAASFLACGATKEGVCVDVAGTASVFAATTGEFMADMEHRMLACGQSAVVGLWHPYAYINGGGMNLEWFRREIANNGRSRDRSLLSFDELNALIENLEADERAPMFVPHMGGRVCPSQPNLRGAWIGLEWGHTIAHLYRAVLEGVAMEYGIYRRTLGELYPGLDLSELRITGGGEKSDVWCQMKADVLETPVTRISRNEGAALGSALLAGFGTGVFTNLQDAAAKWIHAGITTIPNREMAKRCRARLDRYELLLKLLNTI